MTGETRTLGTLAVVLVSAFLLVGLTSASPAWAETCEGCKPWFHLTSGALPTNIKPGVAKSEVQQLTVSATGGDMFLRRVESGHEGFASIKFNAPAGELQTELERMYGAGNVEVSEGEGDETGSKPYKIVFKGELTDLPVEPINSEVSSFVLSCEGATGPDCKKTATLIEVTRGQPDGQIVLTAANIGDAAVNGAETPLTIVDTLPPGLEAVAIKGDAGHFTEGLGPVACSKQTLSCTFASSLPAYREIEVLISVVAKNGAHTGESNQASLSGGGGPPAQVSRPVTISDTPTPFGVEDYELRAEEPGGVTDTLAGSHPFQLTTTFNLNDIVNSAGAPAPAELPKDLHFRWPVGLVGNPNAIARCTLGKFLARNQGALSVGNACPADTQVGVALTTINLPGGKAVGFGAGAYTFTDPVFNLEPEVGEPAKFGFLVPGAPVYINPSLRNGEDYGINVNVENITQEASLVRSEVTVWGVPGNAAHAGSRGNGCFVPEDGSCNTSEAEGHPAAFLTLPTSCTGQLPSTMQADSWEEPGVLSPPVGEPMPALDGCNRLPFSPSISVKPDTQEASRPSGLNVDVHVPQEESLNPNGLSEADPRNITVALPDGLQLSPSAADGLQACSEAQIGFTHSNPETGADEFTPEEASCPTSSKIANATVRTPLLANPLRGSVYLAAPQNFRNAPPENPFSSLVALYLVVRDPAEGVLIKLPGSVSLNEATGQITTTFANSPQAPFEDAELEFFGGERAPLATPALCRRPGEAGYTTLASFTPWTDTPSDQRAFPASSEFNITSGPGGGPCPNPAGNQSRGTLPFNASLASGTTNINAGSFSDLTTTLSRGEGNQNIQSVQLHYPPGVSGLLSGVKLCPEAQANAGTCGPESEIGETIVSVGLGGDPFTVIGGKVYITEKYAGAPFGLSIVNPAKAGPFDLQEGRPVVVRAKINIDPTTAALTIVTDPSGPHAIPTIIEGFPLQIKHVNVTINRHGFTFNPTNCNPMSITGAVDSAEGASSPVSVPFQVTNCASLKFAPKFSVSTAGKSTKANGASLTAKLSYPNAPQGTYANITKVKVELPKQLPSRLTTLQKACTNAQFEANPAGCPPASVIGHAVVHTPLLPVPLTGPAIFVSHGGEAFPSLVIVLQGYGVTVDLVGTTFISKAGVTSTTFKTVPDTPFNDFELTLPQGKFSALASNLPAKANGSFCGQKLVMPSEFIAQNGAVIHQNTPVTPTGCAKKKALSRKQKLAAAMRACKKKAKGKRAACQRQARKRFGAVGKRHKKK